MNSYLIESLAPLVFRSGKPFGSQASAQDVIFPLPSAAAGLVRALSIGQDKIQFDESQNITLDNVQYQAVLNIKAQGPFLARFNDSGKVDILLPKPANSIYLEQDGDIKLVRLSPKAFDGYGEMCGSDLPQGLLPVQMQSDDKSKPAGGVRYWHIDDVIAWQNGHDLDYKQVKDKGLMTIPIELRTHVAIDDVSLASENGKLFQTASFDLAHQRTLNKQIGWDFDGNRLGFVLFTEQVLNDDMATFGGERRLSYFKKINLTIPQKLTAESINQAQGFSLTFMTPCVFEKGIYPAWVDKESLTGTVPNTNVQVKLQAMAIDRWQAVSGWDSLLWKPKATRRAVSAGSVYWFKIVSGQLSQEQLDNLAQSVWSDNAQDKNDGFGSAIIAPFSLV